MFPALNGYPDDSVALADFHQQLGINYGHQMIREFAGNRDYAAALKAARRIELHFYDSLFGKEAERFRRELPKRVADFETRALPTSAQWAEQRKSMSRAEQIQFLCERLRLLNGGRGGAFDQLRAQYREPLGMSPNASWLGSLGKTEVINPLAELVGRDQIGKLTKAVSGLELQISDLPILLPFLENDWMILSVSFWRGFDPRRTVSSTRDILARVINDIPKRQLVDPKKWSAMTETERRAEIARLHAWAGEQGSRPPGELILNSLRDAVEQEKSWREAKSAVQQLVSLKEKRAFPLIAKYLTNKKARPGRELAAVIAALRQLDAKQAVAVTEPFLKHLDLFVKIEASLVLLDAGKKTGAAVALGEGFSQLAKRSSDFRGPQLDPVVARLEKVNSDEGWKALARLFEGNHTLGIDWFDEARLSKLLADRGNAVGLRWYRELLKNKSDKVPGVLGYGAGSVVAYHVADQLVEAFGKTDASMKAIQSETRKRSEERLRAVSAWLKEWIEKVEAER